MQEISKNSATPEIRPLKFYQRESVDIKLNIPKDVVETLEKIAQKKDLSVESVLKFFIGQGLRKELSPQEAKELALKRLKSRKGSEAATSEADLAA